MHKTVQQDLSVLSSARNGLVYLTSNDWALIADKALRVSFEPGATIVERGRRTHGVYLVLKGTARVEIPTQATSPAIGAGEICGELSFLDELPASANVVAQEAVETYYLDRPALMSLFELFPHLASRFYHSLAANLSRRLRDVIGSKPAPAAEPNQAKQK
jgi:CRP-like cAMP-binding protein